MNGLNFMGVNVSYFSNLKIGRRLALAFSLCIALLLVISALSAMSMVHLRDGLTLITNDRYVKVQIANDIGDQVNLQARMARNLLLFESQAQRDKEIANIEAAMAEVTQLYDKLQPMVTSAKGKEMLAAVLGSRGEFRQHMKVFLDKVRAGDTVSAKTHLLETLRPVQLSYFDGLDRFTSYQESLMSKASSEAHSEVEAAMTILAVMSTAAAVFAIVAGVLLTRSITRPLSEAVRIAETVAAGDLTSVIEVKTTDETGQLLSALAKMNTSLVGIVGEVRQGSESIAMGARQISTGNADLSQRTEEQASNLQQTAASMEQLNATVRHNADTAVRASQIAVEASHAATAGGDAVARVVETMQGISESSRRITDIIGVIDGIAFQTNILALNAAVEAARAGEQGRGFAVVAGEVRSLAHRSAQAAKEIKSLIGNSVERVEAGTVLVGDAGRTIANVVDQVSRVSSLISEITNAGQEQAAGIGQIDDAMGQLDQVTQQNAALVEESAAAAESLNQQAARLNEMVAAFKVHA